MRLRGPDNPAGALACNQARAGAGKGLVEHIALVAVGTHDELGQRDREHRRMFGLDAARLILNSRRDMPPP